ncbi:hypothetical protein O3Q52_31020 [Streptomyces sp. ActVer]|uniref:hypothetical protein n=1 Tax=Streptomyces sp. ActVer TaxID=3014558 RepID=UPI0022B37099|nr:hypothetical protein [Streptomyces sp. ActVer]MCZ4512520.1 hypothetical protein [Streptomyces sp. ActVer]
MVAGGWCGRDISRPCPKTAADGCYFCQDFQSDRQFLPVQLEENERLRNELAVALGQLRELCRGIPQEARNPCAQPRIYVSPLAWTPSLKTVSVTN